MADQAPLKPMRLVTFLTYSVAFAALVASPAAGQAPACAEDRSASECAHLRRENERRRALMDAGGRALRVAGPSCTVGSLRWSPELDGFMWIRG